MQKIILIPFLFLLIFGCAEDEDKKEDKKKSCFNVATDLSFQKNAVSLISNEKNIVAYGSIKMNQLMMKGLYDSDLGKNPLIKSTIEDFEKMGEYINMAVPLYYAIKYDDSEDGEFTFEMMPDILIFGKVKNNDKFIDLIKDTKPYAKISKSKKYTLIEEDAIAMAIAKDMFIIRIATGNYPPSAKDGMNRLMTSLHSNNADTHILANFEQSKDITIAYPHEALLKLVEQLNPDQNISDIQMDMIRSTSMDLAFEKGEIKLNIHSEYSDEMKEYNFFGEDCKEVISKLGKGNPVGAIATNINVEEIERFRKKYYPQSITNQLNALDNPLIEDMIPEELAFIEALIMKDGIKSFIDGQMGAAFFIDNEVPEGNFYMGIGANLKKKLDESEMIEFLGLLHSFDLNNTSISGYSSEKHALSPGERLDIKKFENFGKKPFSMYLDLTRIPTEGLLVALIEA